MIRTLIATAMVASCLAACAPDTDRDTSAPEAGTTRAELIGQGEVMAEALCARCHAITREDESSHPEAMAFREISWRYPVESLAEPLAEGIMVGHPDMPEWQFEPKDVDALLAYIESIQVPRGT